MSVTMATDQTWISPAGLERDDTFVNTDPFPFVVANNMLDEANRAVFMADFPHIKGAGYLPYEPEQCGPSINQLIADITAPEFADVLGQRLGIEQLSQYPTYVSICEKLNKRHGTIHTDGKSKVATALVYFNSEWGDNSKGCLRFLKRIDDVEDTIVPEIKPLYGTLAAFKRTDNSFHGHLPFEGERKVIQIAWLVSAADKDRKAKRGKLSLGLKKLLGWIDQKIGQNRKDNASHQ